MYATRQLKEVKTESLIYAKPISRIREVGEPFSQNGGGKSRPIIGKTLHPIRASKTISEEALRQYLEKKHSPLDLYVSQILSSPYYSTIIAITSAEQSFNRNPTCKATGKPSNNLYGMMKAGGERAGIRCFDTLMEGWDYMNAWFEKVEKTRPTIESLRNYYCASACTHWESTVLKIKKEIESL